MECAHSWRNAKDKRKAWARSRDSWQFSETDDRCVATETTELSEDNNAANLELAETSTEENGISNKKIEIWLQDCGIPLGASLDEQSQLALKGAVTKIGCSFEDDLSLGAEANYLHSRSDSMSAPSHGTLAKEKRKQFYQMGNSMNSTGSGKSNTTVSSVSELLDLYEEDPEDVLYNLGFGTDEPDLASKIPCRFFNASSFARGIDFKLFLDAQMQRLDLDNPNFALTSRFRQIKVLTTVANVFSSLYSQVSGAPIKKIGSSSDDTAAGEAGNHAAGRLKKTVSKLNLLAPQHIKGTETRNQAESPDTENSKASQSSQTNESNTDNEKKEEVKQKKEARLQKWRKLTDSSLRTVTEEVIGGSDCPFSPSESIPPENTWSTGQTESTQSGAISSKEGSGNRLHDKNGISDSDTNTEDLNTSTDMELEAISEQTSVPSSEDAEIGSTRPVCSTPDKGLAATIQHPLVKTLMEEQKEFSFDLEEVQSNEGEGTNVPATRNAAPHDQVSAANKKHFTRTGSSHSDSSGFAEDPSSDLAGQCQGPDGYLQAMGSSADSCDSETTVTSLIDDLKTPLSCDQQFFTPFQTPVENMTLDLKETILDLKVALIPDAALNSHEEEEMVENDGKEATDVDSSIQPGEQKALGFTAEEYSSQDYEALYPESDMNCENESDVPTYSVHHRVGLRQSSLDPALCWHSDPDPLNVNVAEPMSFSSSSIDKIATVLERAKTKTYSVSSTSGRARRPVTKASDRIMREGEGMSKKESLAEMKRSTFQRSSSLPTTLLSPVRVVSTLSVKLMPESGSRCSSPTFTYKYTAVREKEMPVNDEDEQSSCRSMLFIPSAKRESRTQFTLNRHDEMPQHRLHSEPLPMPAHLTQSCCSLHALPSDWQGRYLCDHMRARSMCSLSNLMEPTCATCTAPIGHFSPQRPMAHSYHHIPINPPSAIESQLRRVLDEIRSTVQNLPRLPMFQGRDHPFSYYTSSRLGLLPLYETTYQELQIMRRNLNFFRTQMMDLEFIMLRQQTLVYQHLSDEEREEADQLQNLRNCVRMELQELEMQLEERTFALEEQLKTPNQFTMFSPPPRAGAYTNNTDTMSSSSLNVMEPVAELLREQSCLRSELGFSETSGDEYEYPQSYSTPYTNLESTSRCSSPGRMPRYSSSLGLYHQGVPSTTVQYGKPANLATSSPQSRPVYRSSVMLTPSPPARVERREHFTEGRCSPGIVDQKSVGKKTELTGATAAPVAKEARSNIVDHLDFQNALQEMKESLAGEIKREIMDGLLAAISPTSRAAVGPREEFS
ncbi:protein ITPRID2 isoform X1 [Scyliorhinus canicula]|uniref:protein ITPRID2 isoform X1 n=1 Tax=Scyliorhinus canicula TaxID=7830 RepID=UPI0018F7CE50|nr:protein ITPRID2 isoform X1 [Scyliorhinus canicula]XP_038645173.1 protein ITPRID2 isoform X1 [Scyliorhinus canicula]XP_038645174.1 protein ITPRID2 isoform X1 [Scyliorhinus canicula]XP_038645175.1 protein ITPRID2 isoform X1 [Scyliorhinus canicula]XP_038645176.1 protein ITPRID2 isoform X1 [Scyliorhinus canicula]XP_038645177.1 protein ITPRID2 isoform X1 [Scyliorhinus canicula]XP_038645178.1 protein ITPRID2 isoform X1 [Scyliorhinus canicula]